MGANIHSFALPSTALEKVREITVNWLRAKGFEQLVEPPLFPFDMEHERGLVLASNGQWTTVAYSHWITEGERLAFELKKVSEVVLETWVHDSDIWGYRLQEKGRLVASFTSNPRYFGGPPQLELTHNGDPQFLCELIGQPDRAPEVERLQRQRAVFAESIAGQFCRTLGVESAALDYCDFDELGLEPGERVAGGGFEFEMLRFRRIAAHAQPRELQAVRIAVPPASTLHPDLAELQSQIERQMFPWMLLLRYVVSPLLRVVFWVIMLAFRAKLYLGWRRTLPTRPLLAELLADRPKLIEQEGPYLVNRRYRCRILLPEDATPTLVGGRAWVFWFHMAETSVVCDAIRPSQLVEVLRLSPNSEIVQDENLRVGELPARIVRLRHSHGEKTTHAHWYLIQTPQAVYRFSAHWTHEPTQAQHLRLRQVFESFELF